MYAELRFNNVLCRNGARKVIGLEPFPQSFELALQNIKLDSLVNIAVKLLRWSFMKICIRKTVSQRCLNTDTESV